MIYDDDCLRWLRNVPSGVPVSVDASYAVSVTAMLLRGACVPSRSGSYEPNGYVHPRNGSLEVYAAHSF